MADIRGFAGASPTGCSSSQTLESLERTMAECAQPQQSDDDGDGDGPATFSSLCSHAVECVRGLGPIFSTLRETFRRRIAALAWVAGFVIACVALWSTISATYDGRKSVILAEWTAKKDFLEFCQTINYESASCESAESMTLDPPPSFGKRGWGSGSPLNSDGGFVTQALLLIVFLCCAWVGCRRRMTVCAHILRRVRSKPAGQALGQSTALRGHSELDRRPPPRRPFVFDISGINFDFARPTPTESPSSGLDLSTRHTISRRRTNAKKSPRTRNGAGLNDIPVFTDGGNSLFSAWASGQAINKKYSVVFHDLGSLKETPRGVNEPGIVTRRRITADGFFDDDKRRASSTPGDAVPSGSGGLSTRVISASQSISTPSRLNNMPQGPMLQTATERDIRSLDSTRNAAMNNMQGIQDPPVYRKNKFRYDCSTCGLTFDNFSDFQLRHIEHLDDLLIRDYWSCSNLTSYDRAFQYMEDIDTQSGGDVCGFCGETFPRSGGNPAEQLLTDKDRNDRVTHLQKVHKFRECNSSRKFFRPEHFLQHLEYSHSGAMGKWTDTLVDACLVDACLMDAYLLDACTLEIYTKQISAGPS